MFSVLWDQYICPRQQCGWRPPLGTPEIEIPAMVDAHAMAHFDREGPLPTAAVYPTQLRIGEFLKLLSCQHQSRTGGNDYLLCNDCGLMWDYRRETPEHALIRLIEIKFNDIRATLGSLRIYAAHASSCEIVTPGRAIWLGGDIWRFWSVDHVCHLSGYNPMIDPPCPGCDQTPVDRPLRCTCGLDSVLARAEAHVT